MDYRKITTDRQFKDATGYDKYSFEILLEDYKSTYQEVYNRTYENYLSENLVEPARFQTLGDALFFILFQLKNDLIYGSLGLVFGISGASAHKNFEYFLKLLYQTLEKKSNAQAVFRGRL